MRLLLDSHAFLWFILDDPLGSTARSLIEDPTNVIEISPATYWEIAIKVRGKTKVPGMCFGYFESPRNRPGRSRREDDYPLKSAEHESDPGSCGSKFNFRGTTSSCTQKRLTAKIEL